MKMFAGTSKMVFLGPAQFLGRTIKQNEIMMVTSPPEIEQSNYILSLLDFVNYKGWSDPDLDKLEDYCFAKMPHMVEADFLTDHEKQKLGAQYTDQKCQYILGNSDGVCMAKNIQYTPVGYSNVFSLALPVPAQHADPNHVRQAIAHILMDVCVACRILHQHSVCHGDLKLDNIVFDPHTNHFMLTDFGLSSTYESLDIDRRYGNIVCPWYHPIFLTIPPLGQKQKEKAGRRAARFVDRYAFLHLIFELLQALRHSAIPKRVQHTVTRDLVGLLGRLTIQSRTPDQKLFTQISADMNEMQIKELTKKKDYIGCAFVKCVRDHKLYIVRRWPKLFDVIREWAWGRDAPSHRNTLEIFMDHIRGKTVKRKRAP